MAVDYATLKKGGFMRQKQKNNFSLRLAVVGGNLTAKQLAKIAEVAEKYGDGHVHLTSRQGVEIPFIKLDQIDEVKAEDTAETIDEEKEVSEEPAEDKVTEESDEDEEPVFDVSDFLTIIKQDQAKKKELENQLAEVEKRAKQNTLLREKTKAEESFEQEKGVLDKALAMEIISKEEYEQKLNIARKKVENFEEIKKIEQQFEMGIITKEEKDEKINAILNA